MAINAVTDIHKSDIKEKSLLKRILFDPLINSRCIIFLRLPPNEQGLKRTLKTNSSKSGKYVDLYKVYWSSSF